MMIASNPTFLIANSLMRMRTCDYFLFLQLYATKKVTYRFLRPRFLKKCSRDAIQIVRLETDSEYYVLDLSVLTTSIILNYSIM